jgi:nucleoside phosphorylase
MAITVLAAAICACGGTVSVDGAPQRRLAVLSAFPAELAAVLAHATVTDRMEIEGRVFRLGVVRGVPVVLAMTGIGLVNAATTTRTVLEQFEIAGVVVSGVAGSSLRIGDVAVPIRWMLRDGTTFTAHQPWLDLAREIAAPGVASLERCTLLASRPEPVCMMHEPAIVVGGRGMSADPFGNRPFACRPGGNDLYGCDVESNGDDSAAGFDRHAVDAVTTAQSAEPATEDMETAAIAREALAHGVPFIAFRAVSDGAGDPLRLPGFLAQFSAYYHFAARNAAAATVAFLDRLAALPPSAG